MDNEHRLKATVADIRESLDRLNNQYTNEYSSLEKRLNSVEEELAKLISSQAINNTPDRFFMNMIICIWSPKFAWKRTADSRLKPASRNAAMRVCQPRIMASPPSNSIAITTGKSMPGTPADSM